MVIDFSIGFPAKVPPMYFKTKMWHTGVDEKTGVICIAAILPWDVNTGPQKLADHVTSILADPKQCVASNVNKDACEQFENNHAAYEAKA